MPTLATSVQRPPDLRRAVCFARPGETFLNVLIARCDSSISIAPVMEHVATTTTTQINAETHGPATRVKPTQMPIAAINGKIEKFRQVIAD